MKTFIYLPLIALIILTGCKSNKFTTQHYTNYGHVSHKSKIVQREKDIVKINKVETDEKVETEIVKSSSTPVTLIASGFSTLRETFLKPEHKVYDLNANKETSFSTEEKIKVDDSKTTVSSKKTVKEKVKREGFIGSAFATALWIILVVIFIVLIIFIISAVF